MATSVYICSNCGKEYRKWAGKCLACNSFGTLEEHEQVDERAATVGLKTSGAQRPVKSAKTLSEIESKPVKRFKTGIEEFDRVLGGGIVDSEVILLAADPGTGKSTLCLAVANAYATQGKKVLYSSGEESDGQISMRAKRMEIDTNDILVVNETSLEVLLGHIEDVRPDLVIVDSLQTIASSEVSGGLGSITQSKEAAHTLTQLAKRQGIAMILISQVVKG